MISIRGDFNDEPLRILSNDVSRIVNDSTALERAGVYMHGSINRNFIAQGRPNRWRPLAPSTVARRRRGRGRGGPQILLDRGILRASITSRNRRGSIWRLRSNMLELGTNIEYASIQQHGSPRRRIPSRPFVLFQEPEDGDAILAILDESIEQALG